MFKRLCVALFALCMITTAQAQTAFTGGGSLLSLDITGLVYCNGGVITCYSGGIFDQTRKNVSTGLSPYVSGSGGVNDNFNLAFGPETLASPGGPHSNQNLAIGWQSMMSFVGTTGGQNVAVGSGTMPFSTDANFAVAVGTATLRNVTGTGGSASVAIGHGAAGGDDTLVGVGFNNGPASGIENVNVGTWSGQEQTTADANSCVGVNSCLQNSTGGYNTAIGFQALQGDLESVNDRLHANNVAYSVAVGHQAALQTTGGAETVYANGYVKFGSNPVAGNTITLGTTTVTFVASGASGNQCNIGGTLNATVANLVAMLSASVDPQISQARYWSKNGGGELAVQYKTAGVSGNTFALATSVAGAFVGGNGSGLLAAAVPTAFPIVAVGYAAARNNLDGNQNTAIGYASLLNSQHDVGNTAVGFGSMTTLNGGNGNTAMGSSVMSFLTTGASNTAVGYQAGNTLTTGSFNVFVGALAGNKNTVGGIVGVGTSALQNNSSGIGNTAVGYQSSFANTTGINNTSVGYFAGQNNATANYNTSVGMSAHVANDGFGNVLALGYNATPDKSDQTVLGNGSTVETIFFGRLTFKSTYTIGTIPACNAGTVGGLTQVSDGNAPAYNANYTGGGGVRTLVFCNGANWTYH